MSALGGQLAARRAAGRRLLIGYLMAGSTPGWLDAARALVDAGCDALEVGLAFSDPLIDGPVIQAAATAALEDRYTLRRALGDLEGVRLGVPLIAMTYLNVLAHPGYEAACSLLESVGVTGAIIPDLPLDEHAAWRAAAAPRGIETVLLVAPSTTPARLAQIVDRSEGFVYAVGRMAVTGEREQLDPAGLELVASVKARTDLPVCLGIGISTPEHVVAARDAADGVVVGSAIVRRMLEGATPEALRGFVTGLRGALDG